MGTPRQCPARAPSSLGHSQPWAWLWRGEPGLGSHSGDPLRPRKGPRGQEEGRSCMLLALPCPAPCQAGPHARSGRCHYGLLRPRRPLPAESKRSRSAPPPCLARRLELCSPTAGWGLLGAEALRGGGAVRPGAGEGQQGLRGPWRRGLTLPPSPQSQPAGLGPQGTMSRPQGHGLTFPQNPHQPVPPWGLCLPRQPLLDFPLEPSAPGDGRQWVLERATSQEAGSRLNTHHVTQRNQSPRPFHLRNGYTKALLRGRPCRHPRRPRLGVPTGRKGPGVQNQRRGAWKGADVGAPGPALWAGGG